MERHRKKNSKTRSGKTMKDKTWVVAGLLISVLLFYGRMFAMEEKTAVLETSQGNIEILLKSGIAPKACENFIKLIEKGYYNGLIFHRVIKGFMVQGGDPTGTGSGGTSIWGEPFEDEITPAAKFDASGILAMANAGPNTNGSQFFITCAKTPWLNMRHTIFGEVISGLEVVQKIENTSTDANDRPIAQQKINRAYIKSKP
jgi:peptidylprolyl isomerase